MFYFARSLGAVLIVAIMLGGCTLHSSYDQDIASFKPEGIRAIIYTAERATVTGEVLAVREGSLVLRRFDESQDSPPTIVQISYGAMVRGVFAEEPRLNFSAKYGSRSKRWKNAVRIRSRFPQGVNDEILNRLLSLHSQATLESIQ